MRIRPPRIVEEEGGDDDDESDDDFGEVEYDATLDGDDDEVALTLCDHCGKRVYEEAQKCDHCGAYLSREFAPRRRPLWFKIGIALLVVAGIVQLVFMLHDRSRR